MPQTADLRHAAKGAKTANKTANKTATRTENKPVPTAKSNPPLAYHIKVEWLEEGQCYMATSDDLDGLIVEGESLPQLEDHIREVAALLLELDLGRSVDEKALKLKQAGSDRQKSLCYTVSHHA